MQFTKSPLPYFYLLAFLVLGFPLLDRIISHVHEPTLQIEVSKNPMVYASSAESCQQEEDYPEWAYYTK